MITPNNKKKAKGAKENKYFRVHKKQIKKLRKRAGGSILHPSVSEEEKIRIFSKFDDSLTDRYSWAIPTRKAIEAIAEFSPIIEIGAGNGYWGMLCQKAGVDYVGFDINIPKKNWAGIKVGSHKEIKKHPKRTLFLCYADDFERSDKSLALRCLDLYKGDFIVLVGELFGQTASYDNAWGRSFAPEFQLELNSNFHLVLSMSLPSWEIARDSLTVWKRTQKSVVDEFEFNFIPTDQAIPIDRASEKYSHLLDH